MTQANNDLNFQVDVGALTLFDSNQIKVNEFEDENTINKTLLRISKKNFTKFFSNYLNIKRKHDTERENLDEEFQIHEFDKSEYVIEVPERTTKLPRYQKIPKESQFLTRWQKFAKERGIIKTKKRSRMVFDERLQDWVPRWGYKSIKQNDKMFNPIIETDTYDDPFQKQSTEKSLNKQKQKLREQKNLADKEGVDLSHLNKPQQKEAKVNKRKQKQLEKSKAAQEKFKLKKKAQAKVLEIAQGSTKSGGVYDEKAHKKEPKKNPIQKKVVPHFEHFANEKQRNLDVLNILNTTKKVKQNPDNNKKQKKKSTSQKKNKKK